MDKLFITQKKDRIFLSLFKRFLCNTNLLTLLCYNCTVTQELSLKNYERDHYK